MKSYTKKHKWFRVEYEDGDRSVSGAFPAVAALAAAM